MLVTDLLKGLSPEPMLLEVEWVRDRASRVMLADGTVTKNQEVRSRSLGSPDALQVSAKTLPFPAHLRWCPGDMRDPHFALFA